MGKHCLIPRQRAEKALARLVAGSALPLRPVCAQRVLLKPKEYLELPGAIYGLVDWFDSRPWLERVDEWRNVSSMIQHSSRVSWGFEFGKVRPASDPCMSLAGAPRPD